MQRARPREGRPTSSLGRSGAGPGVTPARRAWPRGRGKEEETAPGTCGRQSRKPYVSPLIQQYLGPLDTFPKTHAGSCRPASLEGTARAGRTQQSEARVKVPMANPAASQLLRSHASTPPPGTLSLDPSLQSIPPRRFRFNLRVGVGIGS